MVSLLLRILSGCMGWVTGRGALKWTLLKFKTVAVVRMLIVRQKSWLIVLGCLEQLGVMRIRFQNCLVFTVVLRLRLMLIRFWLPLSGVPFLLISHAGQYIFKRDLGFLFNR